MSAAPFRTDPLIPRDVDSRPDAGPPVIKQHDFDRRRNAVGASSSGWSVMNLL
jgi:hypothetical protein